LTGFQRTHPNDIDNDGDSYTENQGDCDDTDPMTNPNALDFCGDETDQDCNGTDLACLPAEFYGGWQLGENSAADFISLTIFNDGVYMFGENNGIEFGTFSVNSTTNILTVHTVYDQNGENGLSNNNPNTTMTVNGDTLTLIDPDDGAFNLTRVTNASDPIIGAWNFGSAEHKNGGVFSLTIYEENNYILTEWNVGDQQNAGLEFGTYVYANGEITVTVVVDQNGDTGTSGIDGIPVPVVINEGVMTLTIPDEGDVVFYRVK
jgi:hypothetical protein